jgi:hypothetical protein
LLPAGQSGGVEDADESTDEVVGIGVRSKIAAGDGALKDVAHLYRLPSRRRAQV